MAFASASPATASCQPSRVSNSSGVPDRPNAINSSVLSLVISAAAKTVVTGVTLAGFLRSAGTSEIITSRGNVCPVRISVPPTEITFAPEPATKSNIATPKKPSSSVTPEGSLASRKPLPLMSMNTLAPEIGASTTRPSNASITVTVMSWLVLRIPSET